MNSFKNKIAVITGGTDGMGAATALELCRLGAKIFITGRSQAKADIIIKKATKLSGTIEAIISDFSLMKTAKDTANMIAEKAERIDILIHGVGILISRGCISNCRYVSTLFLMGSIRSRTNRQRPLIEHTRRFNTC